MPTPNRQKDGTYSSLTGFHRAVPIILFALSIFIALCFFTKNTGALGGAIGDFLLGSFSVGAYFIPLFLAIHAFFYASDIQLGKPLQRALFTLAVLALISALAHAIANFGNAPIFDAEKFYDDGINSTGGGFVGGKVIGASDAHGERPIERPVSPVDLLWSIYELAGINPAQKLPNPRNLDLSILPASGGQNKLKELYREQA